MDTNNSNNFKGIILSVIDYKNDLKRYFFYFIFLIVISGIGGYLYTEYTKEKYQAVLSFIVENQSNSSINFPSFGGSMIPLMQGVLGEFSSTISDQSNVIEILKSKNIIKKSLNSEGIINGEKDILFNHYITINNLVDSDNLINYDSIFIDSLLYVVYHSIKDHELEISLESNDAKILNIIYNSENQEFAILFTKSLVREMTDFYTDIQIFRAEQFLSQMQDSLRVSKQRLNNSRKNLLAMKDKNIYTNRYSPKLKEFEAQSKTLEYEEEYKAYLGAVKEAQMKLIENKPLIRIIDNPDEFKLENTKRSHWFWITIFCSLSFLLFSFIIILRRIVRDTLAN